MGRMFEVMVDVADLRGLSRDLQMTAIRHWFFENYEDPAQRTPYESAEGGYIYINGGPYDAREVLEDEFGQVVPDDVIGELVNELERRCLEWAPRPKPEDYEDFLLQEFEATDDHYESFMEGVKQVEALMAAKLDATVAPLHLRMLYAGVVTLLETYLGGTFVLAIKDSQISLRRFVESVPEFKKETLALSNIFDVMDTLEQRVLRHLADLLWHNLAKVGLMYKACFDIQFPECHSVYAAVKRRHDIVHRNGKDKDGKSVDITADDLRALIVDVRGLVDAVEEGMNPFKSLF